MIIVNLDFSNKMQKKSGNYRNKMNAISVKDTNTQ